MVIFARWGVLGKEVKFRGNFSGCMSSAETSIDARGKRASGEGVFIIRGDMV